MKITGIIAEYNPMHLGHRYHMEQTREKTNTNYIICAISGNFTQRGDVAVTNKWDRAKMALKCGADVVLELPFLHAVQSAKYFALGGVSLFNSLNCVDYLSFGCEADNISNLEQIAKYSEDASFKVTFAKNIDAGLSYKTAYEQTISKILGIQNSLFTPNNILAIEYLKAIYSLNSKIKPVGVKRWGGAFNDNTLYPTMSSASAIRNAMAQNQITKDVLNNIPKEIQEDYAFSPVFCDALFPYVLYKIRISTAEYINGIYDVCEGLEHKIIKSAKTAKNYDDLIAGIKSKRYSFTKIKRIMLYILFDVTKAKMQSIDDYPKYARVLGFKKSAKEVVAEITKKANLPIITKSSEFIHSPLLNYDILASDIYATLTNKDSATDYTQKLILV